MSVVLASIAGALVLFLVVPTPDLGVGEDRSMGGEASIASFDQRLRQDPNDIEALLGLATVYRASGQTALAAQYLERVIATNPSHADAHMRLASLYLDYNVLDYRGARTVLIRLVTLDPDNPEVYLLLGTAQSELGETKAAILALHKYLQLAPNGDISEAVREQVETLSGKPTAGSGQRIQG